MRLVEKVALVTGGGAGIGRAIVLALAREGADLLIPDIRLDSAEAVAKEVRDLGRSPEARGVRRSALRLRYGQGRQRGSARDEITEFRPSV